MHRLTQYEGFCYCTFLVYCVLCKCPSEASITLLLPLLRDPAHSAATVRHVMDKIKQTVSFLNPGQVPIMTADQPIYAVAKHCGTGLNNMVTTSSSSCLEACI